MKHQPKVSVLIAMTLLVAGISAFPQTEVPLDVHLPILLNVLTFDRNFKQRVDDHLNLAIIYQEKFRESLNTKNQLENFLKKFGIKTVDNVSIHLVPINLEDTSALKSILEKTKINIIYVAPLRAISVESIASMANTMKITSLTGVPEYCNEGIAVGVGSKGGSPQIIINLPATNAQGINFSSRLLKLAKVIENANKK